MKDIEFNLIDEPWLKVIRNDLTIDTLSLKDLLFHAHEYKDLAGETPAQNFAVLRMLLALLYTIFERVDSDGASNELSEFDDIEDAQNAALKRWKELWDLKSFPEKPISNYLNQHYDDFWLFHPTKPFYQMPLKDFLPQNGSFDIYPASKLIGDISESKNKRRLFSLRNGEDKERIPYDEAARWLINLNAFDDTSAKRRSSFTSIKDDQKTTFIADAKPKKKVKASKKTQNKSKGKSDRVGTGCVAKLGMINYLGNNLFETLMLNLTFLKDGTDLWPSKPVPSWENTKPIKIKNYIKVCPDDPAALLSLQSRRIFLERKDDMVTGYLILPGDYFDVENAFNEQMTIWAYSEKESKKNKPIWKPKLQTPGRQMWRDLSYYFLPRNNNSVEKIHDPGIVQWLRTLEKNHIIPSMKIHLRSTAFTYSSQKSSINDLSSDTLTFYNTLLDPLNDDLRTRIEMELQKTVKAADALNKLCKNIAIATGSNAQGKSNVQNGAQLFYQAIDQPFRIWLQQFNSDISIENCQDLFDALENEARKIAMSIAQTIENAAPRSAYYGHMLHNQNTKKNCYYTIPKIDLWFKYELNRIYQRKDHYYDKTATN